MQRIRAELEHLSGARDHFDVGAPVEVPDGEASVRGRGRFEAAQSFGERGVVNSKLRGHPLSQDL